MWHVVVGLIAAYAVGAFVGGLLDAADSQRARFQQLEQLTTDEDTAWLEAQAAERRQRELALRRVRRLHRWVRLNHWLRG